MTDQDDRTGRPLLEERRDVLGISRHSVEEIRRRKDSEALALELGRNGVPARSICPCSVDQDDGRLRHIAPPSQAWADARTSGKAYSRGLARLWGTALSCGCAARRHYARRPKARRPGGGARRP